MGSAAARIIIAASLLLLVSCGSPEQKASKALARSDIFYAQRDYYSARVEIKRAIEAQEEVPDYWARLARIELATSQYRDAYAAYERVVELDPENSEALQTLAELSYAGGQFDDAEKFADQMLRKQPTLLRMLLVKGSVAATRKDAAAAQAIANKMLAIDPGNEGAKILFARVQDMNKDLSGAVRTLEAAVSSDGASVPKLMALLDLYTGLNDFPGSARTFARLFGLLPDNVDIRLAYVRLLYEQGRPDRALDMLARLTRAHPSDKGLAQRIVDIWKEVGSAAVDVDRVRQFVTASGDAQMKIALGHLLIDQKRHGDAERVLRPFIDTGDISAANVEADVLYAGALSGLGRNREALALIDRVLRFDPSNSGALLMRVRISRARGDLEQALRDAQMLVRDSPRLTEGRIALAQIYVRRGARTLADNAYGQAMRDLPDDSAMLAAYTAYLVDRGRGAAALDMARRFTVQNPRLREGWRERARLCIRMNDAACIDEVFAALDRLPGGVKVRRELAVGWRPKPSPRPAPSTGAVQDAPSCGRTGAPC